MSFYVYGGLRGSFSTIRDGTKGWIFVPLSVPLRAKPTLIGKPIFQDIDTASTFVPDTISVENVYKNGVLLGYTPTTKKLICYGAYGFSSDL